jgi:hypothetical protein
MPPLDQDHPLDAALGQVKRRAAPIDPAADHDHVRRLCRH